MISAEMASSFRKIRIFKVKMMNYKRKRRKLKAIMKRLRQKWKGQKDQKIKAEMTGYLGVISKGLSKNDELLAQIYKFLRKITRY